MDRKGMGMPSAEALAKAMENAHGEPVIITDLKNDLETVPPTLEKPYTEEEIRRLRDKDGYIEGCVAVPLSDIINSDFEEFLDLLALKLVDNVLLMDINYTAVGISDTDAGDANIIIKVSGDTSELFLDDEEEEESK